MMRSGRRQVTEWRGRSRKNPIVCRKGKLLVLAITWKRDHQTGDDEGKESQTNEKYTCNQARQQESHKKVKHLGCPPCKIIGTILEIDDGRTSTNEQEDKKVNDVLGLTSERWLKLTICNKNWGEEDSPALKIVLMHQYKNSKTI